MWVPPSRLYAIVDAAVCRAHGIDVIAAGEACVRGGARLLQLRAKDFGSRALLQAAEALVAVARLHEATVIVNDRADVARMAAAGGVHVGQDDLPPAAVRRVLQEGIVGLSTHDEAQVAEALSAPVDYIAVGPVYATATKDTGYAPRPAGARQRVADRSWRSAASHSSARRRCSPRAPPPWPSSRICW